MRCGAVLLVLLGLTVMLAGEARACSCWWRGPALHVLDSELIASGRVESIGPEHPLTADRDGSVSFNPIVRTVRFKAAEIWKGKTQSDIKLVFHPADRSSCGIILRENAQIVAFARARPDGSYEVDECTMFAHWDRSTPAPEFRPHLEDYRARWQALERAVEENPDDVQALLNLARFLEEENDRPGARSVYERMVSEHPDNAQGHFGLARILVSFDLVSQALAPLKRAASLDPENSDVTRMLQILQLQTGERFDFRSFDFSNVEWLGRRRENGIDLDGADLRGKDFRGTLLAGSSFADANLDDANLSGVRLWGSVRGASLRAAQLQGARFQDADLSGADLSNANLSGADLRMANLAGANLATAILQGTKLRAARYDCQTRFPHGFDISSLQMVPLERACDGTVQSFDFGNSDWSGDNEGEWLTGGMVFYDFTGLDLRHASFANSKLDGATFFSTNLEGADFSRSRGFVFMGAANLKSANFANAQIEFERRSMIERTRSSPPDVTGAVFMGVRLNLMKLVDLGEELPDLAKANLTGAVLICSPPGRYWVDISPGSFHAAMWSHYQQHLRLAQSLATAQPKAVLDETCVKNIAAYGDDACDPWASEDQRPIGCVFEPSARAAGD